MSIATKEEQGSTLETFVNLNISPWRRVSGQFVSYGLSAAADSAKLVNKKRSTGSNTQQKS